MATMKKFKVVLEITINDDETEEPEDWYNWTEDNHLTEKGEHIEFIEQELLAEWESSGYDTGDVSQFKEGDKVLLVDTWESTDEDGNESPVDYDEDLDKFLNEDDMVGTVVRVDTGDNTVEVRWEWKDEDGDDRRDDWWVIPRALKRIDQEELKVGDTVKIMRKWTKKESEVYFNPDMEKTIGKTGKIEQLFGDHDKLGKYAAVRDEKWMWAYPLCVLRKVEAEAKVEDAPDPKAIKVGDTVKVNATVRELDDQGIPLKQAIELRKGTHKITAVSGTNARVGTWWVHLEYLQKVEVVEA